MENNFYKFIDVDFIVDMESKFDVIEEGNIDWKKIVLELYVLFKEVIEEVFENIEKVNMDEEIDEICENCGFNMVIKYGRFGKFMVCKNYFDCKIIRLIMNKIGVKCLKCEEGDIIFRKFKRGKVFYGCFNYLNCDFVVWNKLIGEFCEKCGLYMVEKVIKFEIKIVCFNKECNKEIKEYNDGKEWKLKKII